MDKFKWYEQTDPKEQKEQKESNSIIHNADEYCQAIDWIMDSISEERIPVDLKQQIWNTFKIIWWVPKRNDFVIDAFDNIKNTFTTKRWFTKFMLRFGLAPTIIQSTQEKTWIQQKAADMSKNLHFLCLEKDTINIDSMIDECSDDELDRCIK